MSESTYKSHPIWSTVKSLADLLANEKFSLPKVISITKLIQYNLDQTPATLVSLHGLNQLQAHLQSHVATQISNFVANNNTAHIDNAANFIDQTLYPLIGNCFPKTQDLGKKNIAESFETIRLASAKAINLLESEKAKLATKITTQDAEITNLQKKIESLSETISVQKSEAMTVVSQVQKEFADTEAQRLKEFTNNINAYQKAFNAYEIQAKADVSELLEKIEQNRMDGANLLKALGDDSVTGNYRIIAKNESDQANFLRKVTFGFFSLGIIMALITFWKFLDQSFSPENAWSAFIRLLYAIVITTPAWYAAKESARHRSNADRARQTELELTSLGPFIELMTNDKKNLIREELIKTYFGNKIDKHEVAAPIQTKDFTDLATTAIKALSK
jgi:hypothetical protein